MPTPSALTGTTARRLAITAGGGTAGLLSTLVTGHGPSMIMAAAAVSGVALAASCAAKIIESIYQRRPAIITAKGEAEAARIAATGAAAAQIIQATSEANALLVRTKTRAEILRAGTEADTPEQAAEMLRQQSIDADLPKDRRLNDEALAKLLTAPKPRTTGRRPGNGPIGVGRKPASAPAGIRRKPGSGPARVVIPMRPEDQDQS